MFTIKEEAGKERKIIATEAIPKGAHVCTFSGKIVTYEETLHLKEKESFALQIDKKLYLFLDEPYRYFNHCCEPNCGITEEKNLIALQDIPKNEELRYDYSTTMLEHHWTMKCDCKKPSCRKVIADFTTLPKSTQQNYIRLNIVQPFIINELKKSGKDKLPGL